MKTTTVCLSFLLVVAFVKADSSTPSPVDEALKKALDAIEQGFKKFQEATGVTTDFDKEKFAATVKSIIAKGQERINEVSTTLQKDFKPYADDVKKYLENFQKQYAEVLKGANSPETQAKVQKLQETLQQSIKKSVEQAGEVAKSAGINLPDASKKAVNDFFDEAAKLSHKFGETAKQFVADFQAELAKKSKKV